MHCCPHCENTVPFTQDGELFLEICEDCGLILLDFGPKRPRLYENAEEQTRRWDERVITFFPKSHAV